MLNIKQSKNKWKKIIESLLLCNFMIKYILVAVTSHAGVVILNCNIIAIGIGYLKFPEKKRTNEMEFKLFSVFIWILFVSDCDLILVFIYSLYTFFFELSVSECNCSGESPKIWRQCYSINGLFVCLLFSILSCLYCLSHSIDFRWRLKDQTSQTTVVVIKRWRLTMLLQCSSGEKFGIYVQFILNR